MKLLERSQYGIQQTEVTSLNSLPYQFCPLHQCPINTFCQTCRQILCSACAVSSQHKSHECFLFSDIDQEMRELLRRELSGLQEKKQKWEKECHTDDASLDQEIENIEKQKKLLKMELNQLFDEIHHSLQERHEILNNQVDMLCCERMDIISKIKELKQKTEKSIKEFINLDEMATFDLMHKATNSLDIVVKDFNKMTEEFHFEQVHDMKILDSKLEITEMKKIIQNFGRIESSHSENCTAACLYDPEIMNISIQSGNKFEMVKQSSNIENHFIFVNTAIRSGSIHQWKVKINDHLGWIGVGVSREEIVKSQKFSAFETPYNTHRSYFMSSNAFTWSIESKENQKQHGFEFSKGDVLEMIMNGNTRQLTVQKMGSNQSYTFRNIILPVYPLVALYAQDDSVTFYDWKRI
ncbi:hypothetical protein C9374_014285 [Naegleria lovaniensis]|uniref:B box-type domain-containing protein n=1 Tax=Naegleria lovaniensis TaxID=51637 RepID=A0AA88GAM4_NAELO|nr:uncharacterized protein C9374_014285 [Naegleria lovaniensis]KAG2370725.1 hypothetical protein C9374_014285 [Naegleria lovaniensis]